MSFESPEIWFPGDVTRVDLRTTQPATDCAGQVTCTDCSCTGHVSPRPPWPAWPAQLAYTSRYIQYFTFDPWALIAMYAQLSTACSTTIPDSTVAKLESATALQLLFRFILFVFGFQQDKVSSVFFFGMPNKLQSCTCCSPCRKASVFSTIAGCLWTRSKTG